MLQNRGLVVQATKASEIDNAALGDLGAEQSRSPGFIIGQLPPRAMAGIDAKLPGGFRQGLAESGMTASESPAWISCRCTQVVITVTHRAARPTTIIRSPT